LAAQRGTTDPVVVLGGGRGLACLLPALRSTDTSLTVITSIALQPSAKRTSASASGVRSKTFDGRSRR